MWWAPPKPPGGEARDRNRPLLWGDDGRQAFAPDRRAPEGKDVRALRSFVLGTRCRPRERRMRGGLHCRREVGVDQRVADAPDKVVPSGKERVACLSPRSAFLSIREAGAERGPTSLMTQGSAGGADRRNGISNLEKYSHNIF